jgi:hypothetical protein
MGAFGRFLLSHTPEIYRLKPNNDVVSKPIVTDFWLPKHNALVDLPKYNIDDIVFFIYGGLVRKKDSNGAWWGNIINYSFGLIEAIEIEDNIIWYLVNCTDKYIHAPHGKHWYSQDALKLKNI